MLTWAIFLYFFMFTVFGIPNIERRKKRNLLIGQPQGSLSLSLFDLESEMVNFSLFGMIYNKFRFLYIQGQPISSSCIPLTGPHDCFVWIIF